MPTIDTAGSQPGTITTTVTLSLTLGATCNYLFAGPCWDHASATITSIIWNGTETLALISGFTSTSNSQKQAGYGLLNPTTGTHNLVLIVSATCDQMALGGIGIIGANTSTPTGTPVIAAGSTGGSTTNASLSITGAANGLIVDNCLINNNRTLAVTTQTNQWIRQGIGGWNSCGGSTSATTGSAQTIAYTITGADTATWSLGAVEFLAASVAAGTTITGLGRRMVSVIHSQG